MKHLPYGRQFIDTNDKRTVLNSLSNELITTGPFVKKFEQKLNKFLKCKYSHVCSSGTAAIHLAILSLGLKKNDVVLMPAINFIASYNLAKIMQLKIYLVDVDEITGQITPNKVLDCINKNKLKTIKALIVMYNGGFPEYINDFYNLKKKFKFFLIEDACHALGAEYKYKNKFIRVGSCKHADISTFSLHPLKTITSGEGGIVTTNNLKISKNIQLFRSHGILRNKKNYWNYDVVKHGYNYRLSDINCSLGLEQLTKITFFLKKRKKIYNNYIKQFKNLSPFLIIPVYSKLLKPSYHLFFIHIMFDQLGKTKEHFIKYLIKNKIFPQQHYIPIYEFSIYKKKNFSFTGAEKFFKNVLSLPIYVNLSNDNQNRVIKSIKHYLNENRKKST